MEWTSLPWLPKLLLQHDENPAAGHGTEHAQLLQALDSGDLFVGCAEEEQLQSECVGLGFVGFLVSGEWACGFFIFLGWLLEEGGEESERNPIGHRKPVWHPSNALQ